jgi:hypothetical protein
VFWCFRFGGGDGSGFVVVVVVTNDLLQGGGRGGAAAVLLGDFKAFRVWIGKTCLSFFTGVCFCEGQS